MVCNRRPRAWSSLVPSRSDRSGSPPSPRQPRGAVRRLTFVATLLLLALPGCVSTAPSLGTAAADLPSTVSIDSILAKPTLDPDVELEALSRSRSAPSLLRRSYLELYCRRPQAAIDAAAEVLYGLRKPSANEEAFARYLRAEAYTQMGKPEQARFDLERVQQLTLDAELQRRVRALTPPAGPAPVVVASIPIESRSAWSPAPENRANLEPMGQPRRVTIHHSAMYFRDTRPAACAAQIQRIQKEHMGNRDYGDIGYHFLIDSGGRIFQGRELKWQGAHAGGKDGANNTQNIGICMLGDFLHRPPTPAAMKSLELLVADLRGKFQIPTSRLFAHTEFTGSECPGPFLIDWVKKHR